MMSRYFSLSFPQLVVIQNRGLACLYYSVLFVFLASYLSICFTHDMWASRRDMSAHIYPTLSVGEPDGGSLFTYWNQHQRSQLCSSTAYEYRAGRRNFENHTCTRPCRQGEHPIAGCWSDRDAYMSEGSSQVFMTTHYQEEIYSNVIERRSSFFPATEGLAVVLQYKYHQPGERLFEVIGEVKTSDTNVATVLVNADGSTRDTISPGKQIRLSVPQLLEMAGLQGELDAPQAGFPQNSLASGAAPIGRVTGLQLEVTLNCYGRSVAGKPACYVGVTKGAEGWVSAVQDLPGMNGALKRRELHGLRVRVRAGGYFSVFDMSRTMQAIAVGVVILELPAKLVLLFMLLCLGRLSSLYQDAIFRRFSLPSQVASLSARLLSSASAFEQIGEDGLRASRERVQQRLYEALRDHLPAGQEMPSKDILCFLDYSWGVMARRRRGASIVGGTPSFPLYPHEDTAVARMQKDVAVQRTETGRPSEQSHDFTLQVGPQVDAPAMDLSDFAAAYNSTEPLSVQTWLKFFGDGRIAKRSLLEKLFLPLDLLHLVREGLERPELKVDEKHLHLYLPASGAHGGAVGAEPGRNSGFLGAEEAVGATLSTLSEDGPSRQPESRSSSMPLATVDEHRATSAPCISHTGKVVNFERPLELRTSSMPMVERKSSGRPGAKDPRLLKETVILERVDDLQDRMNSLEALRGTIVALDHRLEQMDEALQQQVQRVEASVDESLAKLDKRLKLLKDEMKIQMGPIEKSSSGTKVSGGRIAVLEDDNQRQRDELDALKKRTEVMMKSMDAVERSMTFLSATRHGERQLELGEKPFLLGIGEAEDQQPEGRRSLSMLSTHSLRPAQPAEHSEHQSGEPSGNESEDHVANQPRNMKPGCVLSRASLARRDIMVFPQLFSRDVTTAV